MIKCWKKLPILLALLSGGCVFMQNSYTENTDYDLPVPAADHAAPRIRLGVFKNISGSDRRLLFRRTDGTLAPSEYHRWLLSPELLLQRCMYGAFSVDAAASSSSPLLSGVLYRFEFDEKAAVARFSADFVVRRGKESQVVRVDVSRPVSGRPLSGAACAAAMGECATVAVARLSEALR